MPNARAPGLRIDGTDHRLTEIGAGVALTELLSGFIAELRIAGLPVSLTENLDAMAAVQHIPLEDREAFKYALAATLAVRTAGPGRMGLTWVRRRLDRMAGRTGPTAKGTKN